MANTILSKSDKFTSEYCCTVCRVGEIFPIVGKDRIGYTLVNGEPIVINKLQVKEGDILIYASNETQLHTRFLSENNLFESAELNSNFEEVKPHNDLRYKLKKRLEVLDAEFNKLTTCANFIERYANEMTVAGDNQELRDELTIRHTNAINAISKFVPISSNNDATIAATARLRIEEIRPLIKDLETQLDEANEFIRSHVGFFNKTGRVRAIKLGGVRSMGYLFTQSELAKFNSDVLSLNMEEFVGMDFDTVGEELFVKAYVPFVPVKNRTQSNKKEKIVAKFDRIVKGEFQLHYDTDPLPKNIDKVKPNDVVDISLKRHGTSCIVGNVKVKIPIKLPIFQRIANFFIKLTGLFKSHYTDDFIIDYGNVTSSRTVIRNKYINKKVNDGFYGDDIWSEYGNLLYPYLDKGTTLYGEICGYLTNSDKMLQKDYDYGCERGENFIMPYRIQTVNEDGTKHEWTVTEVVNWTNDLLEQHEELRSKVKPMRVLYHGTLADLYPQVPIDGHWHNIVLEEMRSDVKTFGMEKRETECRNKVPREGIVLRIENDTVLEAFKLKCYAFLKQESELMNDIAAGKAELPEEMKETYL